uniref:Bifunctional lysine-specific demethylase and histidyl-hydroxylase n=1 Tax=Cuerna arida TaxID=1464854 RepID=A0A1B6GDQ5_9HEMI
MKISKEPVSAFAVYSEKFKQKKKTKPIIGNAFKKINKPKNDLKMRQMKEIGAILKHLSDKSSIANDGIVKNITAANSKIKLKNTTNASQQETISCDFTETVSSNTTDNLILSLNKDSKKNTKTITLSKKSDDIGNKHFDEYDKSVRLEQNIELGPIFNKSFENGIIGLSKKIKAKTEKSSKKAGKAKNLYSKKTSSDRENSYSKEKRMKEQTCNDITSNKVSSLRNHGKKENLDLKKKSNLKKMPEVNEFIVKKKNTDSRGRDWMDQEDSTLAGKCLFEWLILPISHQDFMRQNWEKRPLLIQRENNRNYFSELLSTPAIDAMLRENVVCFTKHLDITSYTDGVRETHNVLGRAQPNLVWDFYSNGCSVRLLNPQAFLPKIHALNATLQEYFGCFVGANVYLTPPNSQGFAPHYDDIEAFVLQIEGKKHWKVYPPRNEQETLPRFSSPNFSQEEIGEPILDVTLEPGDLLYFPRGYIHQASTVEGEHSLHITLSAYQKTAWVDLLEKALPLALKRAAAEDVEFRRGLPRNYLNIEHHGNDVEKKAFTDTATRLVARLGHFLNLSLGAGVDQMGAQFMHDALPPVFTSGEKEKSSLGGGLKMEENGKLINRVEFDMDTKVKLVRANICRLSEEEGEVRLYHCLDNPLEYHADEPQFLVLPSEGIPVITHLFRSYPAYVQVQKLPIDDKEALLTLISDLWDAGLLVAKQLQTSSQDD